MLYLAAPSILFLPLNNHIHYFFPCLHLLGTPGPLRQFFQMGFKLFEFFALTCDGNFISPVVAVAEKAYIFDTDLRFGGIGTGLYLYQAVYKANLCILCEDVRRFQKFR